MALREIKQLALSLKREQLSKLADWLHELIRSADEDESRRKADTQHKVVKERELGNKTYRLQGVRCGKEGCKCAAGELHGPYWYAYWSVQGRTKSQYVGKKLPRRKK